MTMYTPDTLKALDDETIERRIEALDRSITDYQSRLGKALDKLSVWNITELSKQLTERITNRELLIKERDTRKQARLRVRRTVSEGFRRIGTVIDSGHGVYAPVHPLTDLTGPLSLENPGVTRDDFSQNNGIGLAKYIPVPAEYTIEVAFKDIIGHVDFDTSSQKVTIKTRSLTLSTEHSS